MSVPGQRRRAVVARPAPPRRRAPAPRARSRGRRSARPSARRRDRRARSARLSVVTRRKRTLAPTQRGRRRRGRRSPYPSCAAPRRERRVGSDGVGERRAHAVALLVRLVALAGDQHDVAGFRASAIAPRDRRAAIELDRPAAIGRLANAPDDGARDRRRILAARIVAGDDDAVGERAPRCAPICGRLPGSRSPPQPNTQTSSPPSATAGRSASSTFSSASGVCA